MAKSTQMGGNRTGMSKSPAQSKEMIAGAQELTRPGRANGQSMAVIDKEYIRESGRIGSMPMPDTVRGALKSGMEKMTGHNPEVFLNKLGERLAFERTGVRLYESVITKVEAADDRHSAGPATASGLKEIRDEEEEHFHLLKDAIESMGADPTALTPDADVSGVAAMGIQQVLNDPRTSVAHCLQMLLILELTDNAAWETLIKLADDLGLDELSPQFERAKSQEDVHLERVKTLYEAMVMSEAGSRPEANA